MDIKNLNKYKYIISSGCSYGRLPEFTFRPFNVATKKNIYSEYNKNWLETQDDIVILNASIGSQGSDWQSDSIIHICNILLEMNILPSNIYVVVEWSQWHRFSSHPYNYLNLDLSKFQFELDDSFYFDCIEKDNPTKTNHNIVDFFRKKLQIYNSKIITKIPKINDRIYVSPCHMDMDLFKKIGFEYKYFLERAQEIEQIYPAENKIKTYLDNIIKTQLYLNNNGLKYNFLFMQTTLSGWYKDGDGLIKHKLTNTSSSLLYNDETNNIENVLPETKNEMSKIDLNNFWFYENEKYKRGGIDEWTLDNFKEIGYIKFISDNVEDIKPCDVISGYGAHPNPVPYMTLWNKVASNCDFVKLNKDCEEFILDKFWEDYESENYTTNGITLSKKFWDKISKK